MLSDYYERHSHQVATMTVLWTALWSHDLFPPIFCLLFAKWLMATVQTPDTSRRPSIVAPDASAGDTGGSDGGDAQGSPQRGPTRRHSGSGSPDSPGALGRGDSGRFALAGPLSPFPRRRSSAASVSDGEGSSSAPAPVDADDAGEQRVPVAHTPGHQAFRGFYGDDARTVSGSHYVALATGAARVFSFDVHWHSRQFVSLYAAMRRYAGRWLGAMRGGESHRRSVVWPHCLLPQVCVHAHS